MADAHDVWGRALRWGTDRLREAGVERPEQEAHRLLREALGMDAAAFYAHPPKPSKSAWARFRRWVKARASGVPYFYLVGHREFLGLDLSVTPAVLIPRPETEQLVELALARIPAKAGTVVDVGTGSGAIALALRRYGPGAWQVVGTEVSPAALAVARENGQRLGLRVDWRQGDLLAGLAPPGLGVVANLPYVDVEDRARYPQLAFEPAEALFAAEGGLAVILRLIPEAWRWLQPGGWIGLEVDPAQAPAVSRALKAQGFQQIQTARDLAGSVRVVHAVRGE
ncbi:MAG: peptide chain release factor N(5)-glutamine methyltransferase [Firmicutes bacterium]|nr:peptide chain release factor N(5)-glutamine methyltransferase [Alicyclobacillaceae bacterium]MCL6497687.1 peptide chain release factor N(5)-glutamine methyltransferase [Bacillota bacterium]